MRHFIFAALLALSITGCSSIDGDEGSDNSEAQADGIGTCFPSGTCVMLHNGAPTQSGSYHYNYPPPLNSNYKKPKAWIDRNQVDETEQLSDNFKFSEFMTRSASQVRFVVLQPHAIDKLQKVRNRTGALQVNSSYRNPGHNKSVGGASKSRHMYGDAFDLKPLSTSLGKLSQACRDEGATVFKYASHMHCDWRTVPQDARFFGSSRSQEHDYLWPDLTAISAEIVREGSSFVAPAEGFDEGEPLREWTAYDADGEILEETTGERYIPPVGTVILDVEVGGQVALSYDLVDDQASDEDAEVIAD